MNSDLVGLRQNRRPGERVLTLGAWSGAFMVDWAQILVHSLMQEGVCIFVRDYVARDFPDTVTQLERGNCSCPLVQRVAIV